MRMRKCHFELWSRSCSVSFHFVSFHRFRSGFYSLPLNGAEICSTMWQIPALATKVCTFCANTLTLCIHICRSLISNGHIWQVVHGEILVFFAEFIWFSKNFTFTSLR